MPIGTGLDSQFGIAVETTVNTFVTPTDFLEVNSASVTPNVVAMVEMAWTHPVCLSMQTEQLMRRLLGGPVARMPATQARRSSTPHLTRAVVRLGGCSSQ